MSYRRRRRYRKPYFKKRRPWYAARNMLGYGAAAMTALKIAKEVKSMVNVEYKYHDYNLNTTLGSPSTTGAIDCVNEVPGGDSDQSRDGTQIKGVSIQMKGKLTQNASQINTGTAVRLILFLATSLDDTEPTVATTELGFLNSNSTIALRNLDGSSRNRYIPLWDKVFHLGPAELNQDIKHFKYYKKISLKFRYASTATDHPRKNALYMIALSDEATNTPTLEGALRIRFVDN